MCQFISTASWLTWIPSWKSRAVMGSSSLKTLRRRMALSIKVGAPVPSAISGASVFIQARTLVPTVRAERLFATILSSHTGSRLLRDWGQESKYNHVLPGYNYRMDGIQGAVLNVKMNYIEAWTEARRAVASQYDRLLASHPYKRPARPANCRHVYHVYAVEIEHRDEVQKRLQAAAVSRQAFTIPCQCTFRRPTRA